MIAEGVVVQNRIAGEEAIQFGYQRLADHLQATQVIEANEDPAAAIKALTAEPRVTRRHAGLVEALAVLLPERRELELHALVSNPSHTVIEDAFLASIVWRSLDAFPADLALDYLNSIPSQDYWFEDRVLSTLLQVACVPDHPYNAAFLHRNLMRRRLGDRDRWWTTFINHSDRETSAVYRIVDWALSDEQRTAASDAVLLCATCLAWFLTASDRRLRDSATKGLVNLLRSRVALIPLLIEQFHEVDDPYVAERVYAAAYGCALATRSKQDLSSVASSVFDHVFATDSPPCHVLLRDYARGVIEVAVEQGALPKTIDLRLVRPPYLSPWPVRPPSKEMLDKRAPAETHSELRGSLLDGIKDFAHYTVSSRVGNFLAPNQKRRRKRLLEAGKEDAYIPSRGLTFPSDEAARWIFRRVLELGWTPHRFKAYDDHAKRSDYDRRRSRVERIGKKYQWIALHELLARLADHCELNVWWDSEAALSYEGPWQINSRDIDPSLIFEPVETPFDKAPETWWSPIQVVIPRCGDTGARHRAIQGATPPSVQPLLEVVDSGGVRFLCLEGHYGWREQMPNHLDDIDREQVRLWLQIRSYLIARDSLPPFLEWARTQDWMGRWMPEGPEAHDVFLGEWPWHRSASDLLGPWRDIEKDDAPWAVAPASSSYLWSGDGDDSIPSSANGQMPSAWLMRTLALRWRPRLFEFGGEDVIALDPSLAAEGPGVGLIRSDVLRSLLDSERLSLVWTILGENLIVGGGWKPSPRMQVRGVAALPDASDEISVELHHWVEEPERD
jgi:hypothetical protein